MTAKRIAPKRPAIKCPDGTKQTYTGFVTEHATPEELDHNPAYKYPHTRIDTLTKFRKFCAEHNLVGYRRVLVATSNWDKIKRQTFTMRQ